MARLSSTLRMDFRLHRRYGFHYAAAFVTVFWLALLSIIPKDYYSQAVILIIFMDLGIVGFFFIAGQILFEKSEKTVYALTVTPLSFHEYLTSKLIAFTTMALVISAVIAVTTHGLRFNIVFFTLGVVLFSSISLIVGLIGVAPYSSISQFIIPSQFYMLILGLPMLSFFEVTRTPLLYLLPTNGALILIEGAFAPVAAWRVIYAVLYQIIWLIILFRIGRVSFDRYIVAQKGGRL